MHTKYRADIDGLRAIAVLSVVAFHAFPDALRGGFVGVDIFFVISGFLISTIILQSLQRDNFSFIDFYIRRVKRIFPALLVVLGFCYLVGWNVLFQIEFKQLNKHIAAGAGFLSNIVLWQESGYFDTLSDTKPLLHLWSLGIEEQFYIVWPLILWFSWKRRVNPILAIGLIWALSFGLNLWQMNGDRVADFYSPQTRFWELAMGAALAWTGLQGRAARYLADRRLSNFLSSMGAVLLAAAVLTISKDDAFPGWRALLPTVGAAAVIAAGPQAWFNRLVLSRQTMVWFGLISYPLYLWHWPLLSFERVLLGAVPSVELRIVTVCAAVGLAWLTFVLVERPLRFHRLKRPVAIGLLTAMSLAGVVAAISFQKERTDGLPRTFAKLNPLSSSGFDGGDQGNIVNGCGIDDPAERALFGNCQHDNRQVPRYALLGDSKAASLFPGFVRTSSEGGRWLFIGGNGPKGSPIPVISDAPGYAAYQQLIRVAVARLQHNADIETVAVVTATRHLFQLQNNYSIDDLPQSTNLAMATEGLSNVVKALLTSGKKVVLIVDNPSFADPTVCLKRVTQWNSLNAYSQSREGRYCGLSVERQLQLSGLYRQLLESVRQIDPKNVQVFDTLGQLCDSAVRMCLPTKGGRLLYSYSDHVSDYAAGLIGRDLNAFMRGF